MLTVVLSTLIVSCLAYLGMSSFRREIDTPSDTSAPPVKPDIILLSMDTLRADHLSCYGYPRETSPNIDRFAENAVIFEHPITQAPHTAPAHMSIFTALTPAVHRVSNHGDDGTYTTLGEEFTTLPEVLKRNGYLTIGFVGGGNISGHFGFEKGFDSYVSTRIDWQKLYHDPGQLDVIRQAIRSSREKQQPLFLFVHHHLCHDPYTRAPEEFRLRFLKKRVDGLPVGPDYVNENFAAKRKDFWKDVNLANPEHREHIVSLYDGAVLYTDHVFGKLVELLKEEGIYDSSVFIALSDHGEEFYEHKTYLHGYLFIETMRVPLIIRFPNGRYAGKRIRNYVRTLDVMPSLLDFLGIKTDHFMQGVSFMPLLTRKGEYDPIILSYSGFMKYIRLHKDGFVYTNIRGPDGSQWLFNTKKDPKELRNLTAREPEILSQMKTMGEEVMAADDMIRERYSQSNGKTLKADEETMEQLRALGYLQ